MRNLSAVLLLTLSVLPATARAEAVTCNLEEVSADQQLFCVPPVVYDEEGEIINAASGG